MGGGPWGWGMGTEAPLKEKPELCSTVSTGQERRTKELEVLQSITEMLLWVGLIGLNALFIYLFLLEYSSLTMLC